MNQAPQLTVSGYRGIWGETLTREIAQKYAHAFISVLLASNPTPTLLIARDGRTSGIEICNAIVSVCEKLDIKYIYADILPTPTVLLAVRNHKYDGAIIVTASHNPIEYNGLKFVGNDALFINETVIEKIKIYYAS